MQYVIFALCVLCIGVTSGKYTVRSLLQTTAAPTTANVTVNETIPCGQLTCIAGAETCCKNGLVSTCIPVGFACCGCQGVKCCACELVGDSGDGDERECVAGCNLEDCSDCCIRREPDDVDDDDEDSDTTIVLINNGVSLHIALHATILTVLAILCL
mmetsp:Transcript_3445/g.3791  ORF Transcript_3445/g.3791 Transcript_3445/m.3791 type:complete len:157 (-) Transcript_3445:267-737(-)